MWDQIVAFVFSIQFTALVLALIGIYALLWYIIENFKSVIQVIRSFLVPYFQPQEDLPLSERFGSWAGMNEKWNVMIIADKNINCLSEINEHKYKLVAKNDFCLELSIPWQYLTVDVCQHIEVDSHAWKRYVVLCYGVTYTVREKKSDREENPVFCS